MFKYLKNKFRGASQPQPETQKTSPSPLPQKLIDIRDDIYNIIKGIKDPEFNNTLEELKVVSYDDILLQDKNDTVYIKILWTPTVEHCKFASHIGLSVRLKLQNELMGYDGFKVDILIKDDKHLDFQNRIIMYFRSPLLKNPVNKQINDKERFCAAQENPDLMKFVSELIQQPD